ncbi:MAG: ankyrin repeat domain-containing protein [Candidatus Sericytochromatia bacterium]
MSLEDTADSDDDPVSMLWEASFSNDLDTVKRLIAEGVSPDAYNQYGDTPLMTAFATADYKIARYLLEQGANPLLCNLDGECCLQISQQMYFPEMALLLIWDAKPKTGIWRSWSGS